MNFALRLFAYLGKYKKKVVILFTLVFLSSILNVLPPLILQFTLDNYIIKGNSLGLLLISVLLLLLGFSLGLQGYFQKTVSASIGHRIVKDIRDETFNHVNKLSFQFYDESSTGDLVTRIIMDSEHLRRFITDAFIDLVTNVLMLAGILIVMFVWNYRFGLIFSCVFPFIFIGMKFFSSKVLPIQHVARHANGYLAASIQECFNGMKEVKLYGREEYMFEIFQKWNNEYFDAVLDSNRYSALWGPYVPLVLNLTLSFIFMFGGLLIIESGLTIGLLMAAITYFGLLGRPIQALTGFSHAYYHAKASADRIFTILDRVPLIRDEKGCIELKDIIGKVEFKDVSFSYSTSGKILKNISLTIEPGQIVALVGPSGVGKSTLIHLVPRFYDVSDGAITIDGVDIRNLSLKTLRKNIGIVLQNVFLFDGTISDNITYGRDGNDTVPEDEIVNAAKIAQLDSFIRTLPEGYNTQIGERGVKLSGGQAQRLSLARVLVTNPKLLILDEPTANVDVVTDEKLMNAVRLVMKDRTTIVIAHRLWTIKNADKIVLLKDGKIEAIGSHKDLIASSEFYREFFESQFMKDDEVGE